MLECLVCPFVVAPPCGGDLKASPPVEFQNYWQFDFVIECSQINKEQYRGLSCW
jgi:hypothetical protein